MSVGGWGLPWLCAVLWLASPAQAQREEPLPDWLRSKNADVEVGNERYQAQDYAAAIKAYDTAARALPNSGGVHLNRGLALMAAGDLPTSRTALQLATRPPADKAVRAAAYYSLGSAFYGEADARAGEDDHEQAQKLFQEAVDSLKQSLRLQPGNADAAWNLELALRRQREEEQKQEQQDQQDQDQQDQDQDQNQQNQDQQNQDQQNQDQENQDQQDQDQQKQDQQNQDQQKQDQQKQDQDPPPDPQEQPLPSDVKQALDALQDGEDNLERHRARQRAARERRKPAKDW